MQEMGARSLGQEDPLENEMATHSRILAWEIPWTEDPGGLQSVGPQRVRHADRLNTHIILITGLFLSPRTPMFCFVFLKQRSQSDSFKIKQLVSFFCSKLCDGSHVTQNKS